MTQNKQGPARLWRRNGAIWLALLLLLMTSFATAYIPELIRSRVFLRLAGAAGLFFSFILFGLTTIEVLMRLSGR